MSEVIGSILVFGLVVSLVSLLQVQAVPNANEGVEIEHNEQLQTDMARLSEAITRTSARGDGESVSVTLGASYPPRLLFFNPPSPSGRLQTTSAADLTIENARATDGETDDYLSGSTVTLETSSVTYTPNYNMYEGAPTTTYDNTVLVDQFADATIVKNRGTLVDGTRISLVTLEDGLNEESAETVSVSAAPVSAPARTVPVSDSGGPITVSVPTRLSESVWVEEVLAPELDDDDGGANGAGPEAGDTCDDIGTTTTNTGDDRYVVDCTYTPGDEISDFPDDMARLELTFERGVTYELRTSRVGFSEEPTRPGGAYVTTVSGQGSGVPEAGAQRLVVEVRDAYNNPVVGEEVTFSVASSNGQLQGASGSPSQQVTVTTNADGQAGVTYIAPSVSGTQTVEVGASVDGETVGSGSFDASTVEDAAISVTVNEVGTVPTGTPPDISMTVSDDTSPLSVPQLLDADAVFTIDWSANDPNADLSEVEFLLIRTSNGRVEDRAVYDVKGKSAEDTGLELVAPSGGGDEYRIVGVVKDEGNNRISTETTDTADGTDP